MGIAGRAAGDALMLLALTLAVYLTAVMAYRTRRIVEKAGYMRVFRMELVLCACLLAVGLDARFGWNGLIWRILIWVPRAVCAASAALLALILRHMGERPAGQTRLIIVLGAALERSRPTPDLIHRLRAVRDYAKVHPDARLIVTGGNGGEGTASEASVMREILTEWGIEDRRIRMEDRSADTIANFENVARMVDTAQPVLLVTSGYHMLRACGLAMSAGFQRTERLSAPCDMKFLPANLVWEIICEADNLLHGRAKAGSLWQ